MVSPAVALLYGYLPAGLHASAHLSMILESFAVIVHHIQDTVGMRVGLLAVAYDEELGVFIAQVLEHGLPVGDHGLVDDIVYLLLPEQLHGLLDRVDSHLLR